MSAETTRPVVVVVVVVATGRRGARYVEVSPTRSEGCVMVVTTRGQRYVVQAESVGLLHSPAVGKIS